MLVKVKINNAITSLYCIPCDDDSEENPNTQHYLQVCCVFVETQAKDIIVPLKDPCFRAITPFNTVSIFISLIS